MPKKITLLSRASTPVPLIVLFTLMVFFVGLMGYLAQQGDDRVSSQAVVNTADRGNSEPKLPH